MESTELEYVHFFEAAVIDIELRVDLSNPVQNAFGLAWRVYNTGEKSKIWCGERWGDWLCWNCYTKLVHSKDEFLQMERGKLIKLLGGYLFSHHATGNSNWVPRDMLHESERGKNVVRTKRHWNKPSELVQLLPLPQMEPKGEVV